MTSAHNDILIVGAGIVGAACADALSADGFGVTVIDSQGVGMGTTAAGMGHLVVMDDSEAQFALTRYSVELWSRLASEMSNDVEFDRCGTLWVATDDQEMAEVRRKHEFYARRGVASEILDGQQVAEVEPNLRSGLAGGLRVPEDSVVYPPTAARWLFDRALARGAKLVRGDVVELSGGRVKLRDGTQLSSDYTINAAGINSACLTAGVDVRPRKGHLVITDRYPNFIRHQLIELGYLKSAGDSIDDSVAFNVQPRKTGQLLIGSSRQYGSSDLAVEPQILKRMIQRVMEYLPSMGKLIATRAWTGFRPSTKDKLPLIGPMPHDRKLILATGHEGLGITMAPATARLIADRLAYRTPAIPAEPYSPARFANEVVHA
jgi:glycine/D-amino acid oxidase-like deaminating enzyme